jgi:hypothetical protein
VIFIYVFYLDVFLGQNFLMNLILLSLTDLFCRSTVRLRLLRRCAAALLGAVGEAAVFLLVSGRGSLAAEKVLGGLPRQGLFVAAGVFGLVPGMVLLAFGGAADARGRNFWRRVTFGWLSAVLLYGVVSAVYNLTGIRTLTVYTAILSFFAARFFVRRLAGSVHSLRRQFSLTLCWHGRSVCCQGLYDSGCLLTMPLSGEPVHIIAPQLLGELLGEERSSPQTIPYHALGTDGGEIAVYRLDQIRIQKQRETKILEQPWVGCAQASLLRGKPYQVILHAGVIDNE